MSVTGSKKHSTTAPLEDDHGTAADDPAAPEVIRYARRAEAPPAQYWRRWSGDAPVVESTDESELQSDGDVHPSTSDPAGPYRILIAEDDPSQAQFAEGVLQGTGMQTLIVSESSTVIDALEQFRPDLVLMDLHMPGLDGMAITKIIRSHDDFLHTPIVFLTGDPDPDRQFEVLAGGADDFLNKPIRPRHLIAAVQSRVQRARKLGQTRSKRPEPAADTGLLPRSYLIERLGEELRQSTTGDGALLFIEIAGAARLRERYGYAAYEGFMDSAGRTFVELADAASVARLNDTAFLVLAPTLANTQVETFARTLRDGLADRTFGTDEQAVRLRVAVGAADFSHAFSDVGAALDAAEQALRAARTSSTGFSTYAPMPGVTPARNHAIGDVVREAFAEHRLELAYQPIVAVSGGDDAQYQTLLRLRNHDGVLQAAGQFLPALEDTELLHDIDRWVLQEAVATLHRRGDEHRPIRLFVSQSPRSLSRPASADGLLDAIATHGIEGTSLVIDLRLSDALIHTVTLLQFCQRLMASGVQFCLSQYEHSDEAQSMLAQLPLGYLRLSSRYSDAQAAPALRDEMRSVIDYAHRLGLQVIGHQIEEPQAAATLWMSGIDYIQGNLVQRASEDLDFDFQSAVL
ncbi:MAG: EAL domain-containing protein [Lysobacter sp.]|nr:EAL domain-containing protein [Lysobacter sp.]